MHRFYDIIFKDRNIPPDFFLFDTRIVISALDYWEPANRMPPENIALVDSVIGVVNAALSAEELTVLQQDSNLIVEEHKQNTAYLLAETPAGTVDTLYEIYNGPVYGNEFVVAENLNSPVVGSTDARRIHYLKKQDGTLHTNYLDAPYSTGMPGNGPAGWSALQIFGGEAVPVHVALHNMPRLWALGYNGEGIRIGVIDTGFYGTHPDVTVTEHVDLGVYPLSPSGHGQSVMGVMAARQNGAGIVGMLPKAQIFSATFNNTSASFSYLISQGVDVINCSFGGYDEATSAAIKAAEDAGILVVVSAGNNNYDSPVNGLAAHRGCVPVTGLRTGDCYERSDVIHYPQILPNRGKEVRWATDVMALVCVYAANDNAPYTLGRGTSYSASIFTPLYAVVKHAYSHLSPGACLELMKIHARKLPGGFLEPDLSFIKHSNPFQNAR